MSKMIITIATLLSIHAFAADISVATCTSEQLVELEQSIEDWKKDHNLANIYYINNLKGQTLGYYSSEYDYDRDGIHAEICESFFSQDDLTISSEWYYWDQDGKSTHPSKWNASDDLRISQDEGFAYFKVIDSNKDGNIKAEFKVVGWMDSADDEVVFRSSVVVFKKRLQY